MKDRVKSAIIMIAITLACMPLAPTRVLFFAVTGGLCAYEYSKNVEKLEARCTLWVMVVYLVAQAVLSYLHLGLFAYSVCFIFCLYLALFSGVLHKEVSGRGALYTLAGLTYPCVLFGILMVISVSRIWWQTLVLACASTWICDSAALFGGTRFGKHKLAPLVSPIPFWVCMLTSFVASTMGQIGDLAESLLKRMIGVKDFSNLIPGHGGVFDRADSLLFSIPTVYLCFLLANV